MTAEMALTDQNAVETVKVGQTLEDSGATLRKFCDNKAGMTFM